MECSKMPIWNEIRLETPDENARQAVYDHWDQIAKPIDGLGVFEHIIAKIGAIQKTDHVSIRKRAVLILCADNGIVEEGISQSGQNVTAAVAEKMAARESSVGRMAAQIGMDTFPIDIGINRTEPIAGVYDCKIRCGTRSFLKEPAMTKEEAEKAIRTGIQLVRDCKENGYELLATGEMGIGNTTTTSALTAALFGCSVREVTGRGAGLKDGQLERKISVIEAGLKKYGLDRGRADSPERAFYALCAVGGLELAGLCGVCVGGAMYRIPIVLDGVISAVSALLAECMFPGVKEFLIASHKGKEPAMERLLRELDLCAVIDADMALGEGTGAVMMTGLLDMAFAVYNSRSTFEDWKIKQYERYQKR